MDNAARVGTAVAAGYLLGRTKKLKLAITVGGLLVGRRIPTSPRALLQEGQQLIDSNPELAKIEDEIRGKLLEAAKGAALATVRSTMDSFSDSLHDRTQSLRGLAEADEGEEGEEQPEDEYDESEEGEAEEGEEEPEEPEDEADQEEPEEEERPRARSRKAPARKPAKKAPAKKGAAKKGAAKKGATKKTAAKKASATKSTARSSARKDTSAKKTTSGNRR